MCRIWGLPIVTYLDPRTARRLRRPSLPVLPLDWQFPVTTHNISVEIITPPVVDEAQVYAGARNQQPREQA